MMIKRDLNQLPGQNTHAMKFGVEDSKSSYSLFLYFMVFEVYMQNISLWSPSN